MRIASTISAGLCFVAGLSLIGAGLYQIYPPLVTILLGVILVRVAMLIEDRDADR